MMRHLRHKLVCALAVASLAALYAAPVAAQQGESGLYPPAKLLKQGYLQVSDLHKLYYEVRGEEGGLPVIVLHGGPGAMAHWSATQFFKPGGLTFILFDQRGAARSIPSGEWRDNNTQLLIEDINTLRDHLGIEGKAILFCGSWGVTLGLAYAEAYPELVSGMIMRGVFLGTKAEADHYWHGGIALFYPDEFERFKSIMPEPDSLDYHRQIFEMTQSEDPEVRRKAFEGAIVFGCMLMSMEATEEACRRLATRDDWARMTVIDAYYSMNGYFLEEGQLLRDAGRIRHIPAFIVNGRFDLICPPRAAILLAKQFDNVKLELVVSGHLQDEDETTAALLRGSNWVVEQVRK